MINTAMFQSLERYRQLEAAMLAVKDPLHPYHWMHGELVYTIKREVEFMRNNREQWGTPTPTKGE